MKTFSFIFCFNYTMAIYTLKYEQVIPTTKSNLWEFISSPKNLQKITPEYMGFEIKTALPEKMYAGMLIQYTVKPILGIKMPWFTEITHVDEGNYFVDEQRIGPYSIWHHQHHLKETENGILMTDIIDYVPPLGPLGAIANSLFIKKQLTEIFAYRKVVLKEIFG